MGKFSGRTGGGRRGRERGGEPGEGEAHASLSRQPRVHTGAGGRRARGCAGAGSPGTVAAGPEWSDGCVLSLTLNVGVFTPWKWAIATIQGFFFFFPQPVVAYLPAWGARHGLHGAHSWYFPRVTRCSGHVYTVALLTLTVTAGEGTVSTPIQKRGPEMLGHLGG